MAEVRKKLPVTTVEMLVADTTAETCKKVSTRFPKKVKESKSLIKALKAEVESAGLSFIKIVSITTEYKNYTMPVEMYITMAKEITED